MHYMITFIEILKKIILQSLLKLDEAMNAC